MIQEPRDIIRTESNGRSQTGWNCMVFMKDGDGKEDGKVYSNPSFANDPNKALIFFRFENIDTTSNTVRLSAWYQFPDTEAKTCFVKLERDELVKAASVAEATEFEILPQRDCGIKLKAMSPVRYLKSCDTGNVIRGEAEEADGSTFYFGDCLPEKREVGRTLRETSFTSVKGPTFIDQSQGVRTEKIHGTPHLIFHSKDGNASTSMVSIRLEPHNEHRLFTFDGGEQSPYYGAVAFSEANRVAGMIRKRKEDPIGDDDTEIFVTTESGGPWGEAGSRAKRSNSWSPR